MTPDRIAEYMWQLRRVPGSRAGILNHYGPEWTRPSSGRLKERANIDPSNRGERGSRRAEHVGGRRPSVPSRILQGSDLSGQIPPRVHDAKYLNFVTIDSIT